MEQLEITKLSSKGQIVLPQAIRQRLHLVEGERFVVLCEGDAVILKKIGQPVVNRFKELLRESRLYAKKAGLSQSDVKKAIERVRSKTK